MKNLFLLTAIALLLIVGCARQQEARSPLEGVWQVAGFQAYAADTLSWELGVNVTGTEMKIWSGNYFVFVGKYTVGDSTRNNYGGGSYVLDGNKYQENLIYPDSHTVKLLLEIKNDTIIQKWPCDDNWQLNKSNYFIQKLTRKD